MADHAIEGSLRHAFEALYSRPPTAQWDNSKLAYTSLMEDAPEAIRDELRTYTTMLYAFSHGARWRDTLEPRPEPRAWMNPHDGEVVSAAEKHSMETNQGVPGQRVAQRYSQPLYTKAMVQENDNATE